VVLSWPFEVFQRRFIIHVVLGVLVTSIDLDGGHFLGLAWDFWRLIWLKALYGFSSILQRPKDRNVSRYSSLEAQGYYTMTVYSGRRL
jgi:membrane-associated PAP2 superfamily phosphatase